MLKSKPAKSIPRILPLQISRVWVLLIAICVSNGHSSDAVEPAWLADRSHDVETTAVDAAIKLRTTGNDPYLIWRLSEPLQANQRVLQFEYFSADHVNQISLTFVLKPRQRKVCLSPDLDELPRQIKKPSSTTG